MSARRLLHELVDEWEAKSKTDPRSAYRYHARLSDILFHASLRFGDYKQFREDGDFVARFWKWLGNVPKEVHKKALFILATHIMFIDSNQFRSLHRDAYRRIISPWLTSEMTPQELLQHDLDSRLIGLLKHHVLLSVTQSFSFPDFLTTNSLVGIPVPTILGENCADLTHIIHADAPNTRGIIVFEDFVGTGSQASKVLLRIREAAPQHWRLLFVPLIMLERGVNALRTDKRLHNIDIMPVITISGKRCLSETFVTGEEEDYVLFRSLATATRRRVLEALNTLDDPPSSEFGYKKSGAMLVTAHNTPNNTLPMICHKAPDWFPLFRRRHHSKDGL